MAGLATRMKIDTTACKYAVVRKTADETVGSVAGSEEVGNDNGPWHIWWTDTSVNHERAKSLSPLQKLNHFVDMTMICRKATSAALLNRNARYSPLEFAFHPRSWQLPKDLADLTRVMRSPSPPVLIVKPNKGSQGAGISICRTLGELDATRDGTSMLQGVAQEYVDNPLLLDGHKFDLRLYVLVTSCSPLRVHLYRDGLARLCTEPYHAPVSGEQRTQLSAAAGLAAAKNSSDWRKRHLTNYAINKLHCDFSAGEDGAKRRLGDVLDTLSREHGLDVNALWGQIQQLVVKTLLAVQPHLAHAYASCRSSPGAHPFSCFELLGFDLLIDANGQPWLLEVNHSPSLATDSELDTALKTTLLADTMRLVSFSSAEARLLSRGPQIPANSPYAQSPYNPNAAAAARTPPPRSLAPPPAIGALRAVAAARAAASAPPRHERGRKTAADVHPSTRSFLAAVVAKLDNGPNDRWNRTAVTSGAFLPSGPMSLGNSPALQTSSAYSSSNMLQRGWGNRLDSRGGWRQRTVGFGNAAAAAAEAAAIEKAAAAKVAEIAAGFAADPEEFPAVVGESAASSVPSFPYVQGMMRPGYRQHVEQLQHFQQAQQMQPHRPMAQRVPSESLPSQMLALRQVFEAENAGEFELVYPPSEGSALNAVYASLLERSKRSLEEERGMHDHCRGMVAYSLLPDQHFSPRLPCTDAEGNPYRTAAHVDGDAPSASKGNLAQEKARRALAKMQAALLAELGGDDDEDSDSDDEEEDEDEGEEAGLVAASGSAAPASIHRLGRLLRKARKKRKGKLGGKKKKKPKPQRLLHRPVVSMLPRVRAA